MQSNNQAIVTTAFQSKNKSTPPAGENPYFVIVTCRYIRQALGLYDGEVCSVLNRYVYTADSNGFDIHIQDHKRAKSLKLHTHQYKAITAPLLVAKEFLLQAGLQVEQLNDSIDPLALDKFSLTGLESAYDG